MIIKRSKPDSVRQDEKTSFHLYCDRHGEGTSKSLGIRTSSTKCCSCLFRIIIRQQPTDDTGLKLWRIEVKEEPHNHLSSLHAMAHAGHRRRDIEARGIRKTIKDLTNTGVEPRRIYSTLTLNKSSLVSARDMYNHRNILQKEYLDGLTPIEALMNELSQNQDFVYRTRVSASRELKGLFFATKDQITLFRASPDILLFDCTYRTNRYNMPLLHIAGVTATRKYFSVGFVFLSGETEEDYEWAIESFNSCVRYDNLQLPNVVVTDKCLALKNALKTKLNVPQLLCLFHINRCVQHRIKQEFRTTDLDPTSEAYNQVIKQQETAFLDWQRVVQAANEESYFEAWTSFLTTYSQYDGFLQYLQGTWLPYKEQFCKAWTNQIRHFDNTTTSPLEGLHGSIKRWLSSARLNLNQVVKQINLATDASHRRISEKLGLDSIRLPARLSPTSVPILPRLLHQFVSNEALELIVRQWKKAQLPASRRPTCTNSFARIFGLPCAHQILNELEANKNWKLKKEHIDDHWFYVRDNSQESPILDSLPPLHQPRQPIVLPPGQVRSSGRPRNDTSTRRSHSFWEEPVLLRTRVVGTATTIENQAAARVESEPSTKRRRGRPLGLKGQASTQPNAPSNSSTAQPQVNSSAGMTLLDILRAQQQQ
jgi:hypothetical protein